MFLFKKKMKPSSESGDEEALLRLPPAGRRGGRVVKALGLRIERLDMSYKKYFSAEEEEEDFSAQRCINILD